MMESDDLNNQKNQQNNFCIKGVKVQHPITEYDDLSISDFTNPNDISEVKIYVFDKENNLQYEYTRFNGYHYSIASE